MSKYASVTLMCAVYCTTSYLLYFAVLNLDRIENVRMLQKQTQDAELGVLNR